MTVQYLKRSGIVVTLVAVGALAGTAALALVGGVGGTDTRVYVRSERNFSKTNSTVFVDLPGANVLVSVANNTSRLFIVRFAGASLCNGPAAAPLAHCSLQVIATNTVTSASVPFDPASGIGYAFDTNPAGAVDDLGESNAMERSKRLPGGTYRIRLQRAVTNATTTFTLDDWHFSVETRI